MSENQKTLTATLWFNEAVAAWFHTMRSDKKLQGNAALQAKYNPYRIAMDIKTEQVIAYTHDILSYHDSTARPEAPADTTTAAAEPDNIPADSPHQQAPSQNGKDNYGDLLGTHTIVVLVDGTGFITAAGRKFAEEKCIDASINAIAQHAINYEGVKAACPGGTLSLHP